MTETKTLIVREEQGVLEVILHRPEVHNAFNDELITEAIELFESIARRDDLRAVVLRGGARISVLVPISTGCRGWSVTRGKRTFVIRRGWRRCMR